MSTFKGFKEKRLCACGCGDRVANRRDHYRMECYYKETTGEEMPMGFTYSNIIGSEDQGGAYQ